MANVLVEAKRILYQYGVTKFPEAAKQLKNYRNVVLEKYQQLYEQSEWSEIRLKVELITLFEKDRIMARLQEILTKQPYIEEDSLVASAIPVVVEQKLNGLFLGLSQNLSTDAYTFSEPMVLDLKFGSPQKFHHLTTTGYAMVMESEPRWVASVAPT